MNKQLEQLTKLKAELTSTLKIDPKTNPIKIKAEGDAILMEGTVAGIDLKKKALLIAMDLPDFTGIIDRLRVKPSSTMGHREIAAHIKDAFTEEPTLDAAKITIDVNIEGVVDIEGTVASLSHKRIAGVLAWWVPGVADVINSLEVTPPEEDNADEITDAVKMVLEKDTLVDESSIRVHTEGWIVRLSGVVKSEEQKQAAENDAWYIWGVHEVINELEV